MSDTSDRTDLTRRQFVGDLGLPEQDVELHVSYGADLDGNYVDWSISIVMCRGPVSEVRRLRQRRPRKVMERVRTLGGRLIRQQFNPEGGPPTVTELHIMSGDPAEPDELYDLQLRAVSEQWAKRIGPTPDPHQVAIFGYANVERPSSFHENYPGHINTVVAVENDTVDEAITDRLGHYFPDGAYIAAYFPGREWFGFRDVSRGASSSPTDDVERVRVASTLTIGMIVDSTTTTTDETWQIPDDWQN